MENEKINTDKKLAEYKFEMENEDNDGWTKLHYKKAYEKRCNELLIENSESEFGGHTEASSSTEE
jgi:hypothetical protein